MPYIEGDDRNQIILFPESIDDYISIDNPVRIIDIFVEQLDMVELGFKFAIEPRRGRPPYRPQDMLKLYIYGYQNRIRSSRRLEHEARRNLEVIWLLRRLTPDFKTIADFRKNNKKVLKEVFRAFNNLCSEWDMFGKELVAIDSSKFKASNSKKKNFNQKKIDRYLRNVNKKINDYLKQLDDSDEEESCDRQPDAEEIKKRIEQLRKRKEVYENHKKALEETGENEISTTDPDAKLMSSSNFGVDVGYNVQTSVDAKEKRILDFEVTNQPNDLKQLGDMAKRAKELSDVEQLEVVADKGYYNAKELKECVKYGITPYVAKQTYSNGTGVRDYYADRFRYDKEKDVYICPAGKILYRARTRRNSEQGVIGYDYRNYKACSKCPFKEKCTRSKRGRTIYRHVDQDFLDGIDLRTEANIEKYKLRQMIVEHPFGTIKRSWQSGYFLTRGKRAVTAEMSLTYLAYNLRRAINILGTEEILRKLKERRKPVLV